MEEYLKYQHVEKLSGSSTGGIDNGTVYVFPKLDGTNAHIWMDDKYKVRCGSRRREITPFDDNAGFAKFIDDNLDLYTDLLDQLQVGAHVYGEWLVPHTFKNYADIAWRRFYIFDVVLPDGTHMPYDDYKELLDDIAGIDFISPLRILINPGVDDMIKCLDENDFLVQDGKGVGEGVVLKNYDYTNRFGRQTWAKIVTSDFKAKHRQKEGAPVTKLADAIEPIIVDQFLTRDIIDKVVASICPGGEWEGGKNIPRLLQTVWYDFINECLYDALNKHKNPRIDFKYLNRLVIQQIKEIREDLF